MEMKRNYISLGRNSLNDAPYRGSGIAKSEQGLGRYSLSGAPYRGSGMVKNMQGLGRHSLSGALHRRFDVVINEQGSSHFTRRMRRARKLVDESRIRLGSWNVGSLTGKLREIVDTMTRRRVNILCV